MAQKKVCDASQLRSNMTFERCEVNCCEQDKCNDAAIGTPSGSTSVVIMSITALYAGICIQ